MLKRVLRLSGHWFLCGILAVSVLGCYDDGVFEAQGDPLTSRLAFYNEMDVPTSVFQSGEQIKLVFTITNMSSVTHVFNFGSSCQFALDTANGPDGPWRDGSPGGCLTILTSFALDPFESHTYEIERQLNSTGIFWVRGRLFTDMPGATTPPVSFEVR